MKYTKQILKNTIGCFLIVAAFATSAPLAQAQTPSTTYQPQTVDEMIAYLYGIISQLQALIDAQESGGSTTVIGVAQPGSSALDIEVDTLSARDIAEDEADLRGQIDFNGDDYATVWFEYGEDTDLDERSIKRKLYDDNGEVQTFTITVDDLQDDEKYYYRAVAEDAKGRKTYGSLYSFITDDSGSAHSSGDFELAVDDTSINEGDTVEVDWEVPDDAVGSRNWIGLYERGDDNDEYIAWKYIAADDTGSVRFVMGDEGEYEFRLFLNNSYDDEVTSARVTVN